MNWIKGLVEYRNKASNWKRLRVLLTSFFILMILHIVLWGIESIDKGYFEGNAIISKAVNVLDLLYLLLIIGYIIVSFIKDIKKWDNETFTYIGREEFEEIDTIVNKSLTAECRIEDAFCRIKNTYESVDYTLDELLIRRHFVENKLNSSDFFKDVLFTVLVSIVLQFSSQIFYMRNAVVSAIVTLLVNVIWVVFLVLSVMMDYIKPVYNRGRALYRYEHEMLQDRINHYVGNRVHVENQKESYSKRKCVRRTKHRKNRDNYKSD